jgi:magnesium-transporting ATPase (P-type)
MNAHSFDSVIERPASAEEACAAPCHLPRTGLTAAEVLALRAEHGDFFIDNPVEGRSIVFASFAVNSMIYIFGYRSLRRSLFRMGPLSQNKVLVAAVAGGLLMAFLPFVVPPIGRALEIVPLSPAEWGLVGGVALTLLAVVEIGKSITQRTQWRTREQNSSNSSVGGLS